MSTTVTCVATYARRSTEQTAGDDAKSVTRQLALGRAFAGEKGWRVVAEFADDAVSGALTSKLVNRARLLAAAAEGKFSAVVVRDYDRLSRDDREGPAFIYALEDLGVEIWYYADKSRVDTRTALSRGMLSMKATFAAAEREAAAARTHEALRAKAQRGHVPNGVCYGYENIREGDHSIRTIVPGEAAIIVQIFEMAARGAGYRRIAYALNAEHAPAPAPRRPGRTPSWSMTTIRDALHRELYRGVVIWNQRRRAIRHGKRTVSTRPPSEWIRREAPELRIVSDDLWRRAHERLSATRATYLAATNGRAFAGRPIPGTESRYLLTGMLTCAVCTGTMFVQRHGSPDRDFFAYMCTRHHTRGRSVCPNGLEASMVLADEAVLAAIEHDLLSVPVLETALAKAVQALQPAAEDGRLHGLRKDLATLDREVANLTAAIAAGKPLEGLLAALQTREQQRAHVRAAVAELEHQRAAERAPRDVLAALRTAVADPRGTLRGAVGPARLVLRALLAARLTFTPQERAGERFYRFEGPGTVSPILAGVLPMAWASRR
jgi:DNA invertase Pin-like site-specific DNA recombinase